MSSEPRTPGRPSDAAGPRFAGKVALVTGASDKGIGGAIAERIVDEGGQVALLGLEEPTRLLKRFARRNADAMFVQADVSHPDQVQQAVGQLAEHFGRLDVVVNNAGLERNSMLERMEAAECRELLDINLFGAVEVSRTALPHMTRPGGVIVNVSSGLALAGCAGFSVYSASKAGLVGFTQSLAVEVAPDLRVVAVAPGLVHTPMIHKHVAQLNEATRRQIEASHPLGVGMPHHVAAAVCFLASDDASWITGITLPCGWSAQYALPVDHFLS